MIPSDKVERVIWEALERRALPPRLRFSSEPPTELTPSTERRSLLLTLEPTASQPHSSTARVLCGRERQKRSLNKAFTQDRKQKEKSPWECNRYRIGH